MSEIYSSRVSKCTEKEAWAMALCLYRVTAKLDSFAEHEECQKLYLALVSRLKLEKKVDDILDTAISSLIHKKRLTVKNNLPKDYNSPYDKKGRPRKNFKEDRFLYDESGSWISNSDRAINIIRVIFSEDSISLSKLVALTFFSPSEEKINLRQAIKIPERIKQALDDISPVRYIANILELSKAEAKVLNINYLILHYIELWDVVDDFYKYKGSKRIEVMSILMNITPKEIRTSLGKDGKLVSFGLFSEDGAINKDAFCAILEEDIKYYFTDIIKRGTVKNAYSLNSFAILQKKVSLTVQFLKASSSCNILLYGAPGAGKTEFAKSLVKASGLKMLTYKNNFEIENEKDTFQAIGKLNCFLSLNKNDSILVVDEAETVLKTVGVSIFGAKYSLPQKGTVNKMLDNSKNKVIWILNYIDELDESTLRRFTYSIRFHEMSRNTICNIAEKKLNSIVMSGSLRKELVDMCGNFHVTGASVDNIVKAISGMDCSESNRSNVINDVKSVLESNSSLIYGNSKIRSAVSSSYDLSVLNTSIPAVDIVEMIQIAISDQPNSIDNKVGIRMLFYGLSGTGKTELARYIAEKIGKKILLKRASDILGKYVGESEKNIKMAFDEAFDTDSILLFDEADSFFANREDSTASWERTMVNEFLTQMEDFNGILICTTNLRKIMDPAMQRRFHILTEFKPLKRNGIEILLMRYFNDFTFELSDIEKLSKTDSVTPGDFSVLSDKLRFVPKNKVSGNLIINELLKLQSEKTLNVNCKIGFAG